MAYGTIKVDTVTFTNDGVDKSVTLSGLVQNPTFSGNVTVTGTLSGVTVTGTTASFTSGNFTNISGGTHTITSGVFAAGSAANPSITFTGDLNTGIYSPGADQVAISTGGSGRLFVDASGNVRITSGSAWATADGNLQLSFSTNEAYATTYYDNHSITFGAGTSYKNKIRVSATGADNAITFHVGATSPNERMRITGAGLVGIGTAQLYGILTARAGTNCNFHIRTPSDVGSSGEGVAIDSLSDNAGGLRALFMRATEHVFLGSSSERLRITSAGLVGIGTSSPSGRLTIANDSALNEIEFTGNDYTNVYSSTTQGFDIGISNGSSTGPLRLLTANTERLRITSAGNVGIGTTSPLTKLDVRSGVITAGSSSSPDGTEILRGYYSATDGALAVIGTEYSSGGIVIGSAVKPSTSASDAFLSSTTINVARGAYTIAGNTHKWYIGAVQTVAENSSVSTSEVMRIDSAGRLLVGTSSARSNLFGGFTAPQLQVEGTSFAQTTFSIVRNENISTSVPGIVLGKTRGASNGANTVVQSGDNLGLIDFQGADGTNLVTAARISADVDGTPGANDMPGRLVFSTTADGASAPTEALRIINSGRHEIGSAQQGIICGVTSAAGTATAAFVAKHSITQGSVTTTGTDALIIWSNGNVVNLNNSYGAISDVKLKENIVDATSQWSDIKALQVRKYNFKEGQTHTQIGLVAQEVELVSPGLVSESPDRDAEGNDLGTVTKSVNYSVLYMKAVKALQEAMERIELLEARLDAANL